MSLHPGPAKLVGAGSPEWLVGETHDPAWFRTAMVHSRDAMFVQAADCTILEANPAACALLGYSRDELVGLHPRAFDEHMQFDGPEAPRVRLERGEAVSFETWHVRKDGLRIPVTVRTIPLPGTPHRWLSFAHDLSHRVANQAALAESEAALKRAQSLTRIGHWRFDRFLREWTGSDEFWRICGMSTGPHGAQELFELVHPEDRAQVRDVYVATCNGKPSSVTHRIVGKRTVWLDVRTEPLRNASGDVIGVSGTSQDVSERKELELELRQKHKLEAIGQLAGGVAHDFNNLLTVINGLSDDLGSSLPAGPTRDDVVAIRDAGRRAATLTRQLLAFSRRSIIEPVVFDLNRRIAEITGMMERLIGEDIALTSTLASDLSHVTIDAGHLDQMLVNLVLNARDAMPDGGTLLIATQDVELVEHESLPPGRYVQLRVQDTGVGMTEAVKASVFEPFFTTKEVGRGTGLGLATVYGVVQEARGHIAVDSEPGRGTVFTVLLPAAPHRTGGLPAEPEPPLQQGNETILLVEDERAVRKFICTVLRRCGYTVLEADSGKSAIETLATHAHAIDLLLTDVVMPEMGGRDLALRVRAQHPAARVLFMSGYTKDVILRQRISEAEEAFLHKPFTSTLLADTVGRVLKADR
jgi:PAS domain S-box-containing protein